MVQGGAYRSGTCRHLPEKVELPAAIEHITGEFTRATNIPGTWLILRPLNWGLTVNQ